MSADGEMSVGDYLRSPMSSSMFAMASVFLVWGTYELLSRPLSYHGQAILVLSLLALVVGISKRSRWVLYAILAIALGVHLFEWVHIIANGVQDIHSTRDAAVEVTTQALLDGENAWNRDPGVVATTGPVSILAALPFVAVFQEINWLSYIFWIGFFSVALAFDLQRRNGTWPLIVAGFMTGVLGIEHTLFWSLEELYYPIVYLALGYVFVRRRSWYIVGGLLALALLTRLNYAFPVMGFMVWLWFSHRPDLNTMGKLAVGGTSASLLVLAPFVLIGGEEFWAKNPWSIALEFSTETAWGGDNLIYALMESASASVPTIIVQALKVLVPVAILIEFSGRWKETALHHPFWHIAIASFLVHAFIWPRPTLYEDYGLMFVLPLLLGLALIGPTRKDSPAPAVEA